MNDRSLALTLLSALLAASCANHQPSPSAVSNDRAVAMVSAACPSAESEEVESCAYGLVQQIDAKIRKKLCEARPAECAVMVAAFQTHRDGLTQAYLAARGDFVVARVGAALFALTITSEFEQQIDDT